MESEKLKNYLIRLEARMRNIEYSVIESEYKYREEGADDFIAEATKTIDEVFK